MASQSKVVMPGSETYALKLPSKTSGLQTLARMHQGEDDTFDHAVVAFRPDLTREEIDAQTEELKRDDSVKKVVIKVSDLSLKGTMVEFPMSKIVSRLHFRKYFKLSNFQFNLIFSQSMFADANEVNVTLIDKRLTIERTLQQLQTTSQHGERTPFSMSFSVPVKNANMIVLRVTRATLPYEKKMEWGSIRYSGVITYSNTILLSAENEVVSTSLLPQGALDDHVYNPLVQDKRLNQDGLEALRNISDKIRNETVPRIGGKMTDRKAGTIIAGSTAAQGTSTVGKSKYTRAQTEDYEEDPDTPEYVARASREERERKEMWGNLVSASQQGQRMSGGESSQQHRVRKEVAFRESALSDVDEERVSEEGVLAEEPHTREGDSAQDYASKMYDGVLGSARDSLKGFGRPLTRREESIRSTMSRVSSKNPFIPSMLEMLRDEEKPREVEQPPARISYVPKTVP